MYVYGSRCPSIWTKFDACCIVWTSWWLVTCLCHCFKCAQIILFLKWTSPCLCHHCSEHTLRKLPRMPQLRNLRSHMMTAGSDRQAADMGTVKLVLREFYWDLMMCGCFMLSMTAHSPGQRQMCMKFRLQEFQKKKEKLAFCFAGIKHKPWGPSTTVLRVPVPVTYHSQNKTDISRYQLLGKISQTSISRHNPACVGCIFSFLHVFSWNLLIQKLR